MTKAGLYVHIPFCSSKCPYCDFVSFKADFDVQRAYVDALKREIDSLAQRDLTRDYVFDTVFIGGGTPSALYKGGLTEILTHANKHLKLDLIEFTVEANPESMSGDFLSECHSLNANRLSLGLQSASDSVLKGLRCHTYNDFLKAHDLALKYGITNINADLMLGLPNQTAEDVINSLNKLIALKLKHISIYGLKVEEGTSLHKCGYEVDDDKAADFYDIAVDLLKKNSYHRYEVSNFALKGYECRHNQGYWEMKPYLGLGLNASSYYHTGLRTTNTAVFNRYLSGNFVETKEDVSEKFDFEYIMLSMRTDKGVNLNLLSDKGEKLLKHPKTKEFLAKNAFILKENKLLLNESYFYLMNQFLAEII